MLIALEYLKQSATYPLWYKYTNDRRWLLVEAATGRVLQKKMFLKILQNSQRNTTGAFLWILRNFQEQLFCRTLLDGYFCTCHFDFRTGHKRRLNRPWTIWKASLFAFMTSQTGVIILKNFSTLLLLGYELISQKLHLISKILLNH